MNSQGRNRRSGSLPPNTRVPYGRPSLGAQRVPAAAFDNRASGIGLSGSTMKRSSSSQALHHNSALKKSRPSMASSSSSSAVKDTRPFSDRTYREKMIQQLVEFLTSHGYPHPLSLRGPNGPSTTDFRKIFEFMVNCLQPGYKLGPKLEEEVPRVLKDFGYPVTITTSHLRTIGVPGTWVVLIAALTYLRTIIETTEMSDFSDTIFGQVEIGSSTDLQAMHEYVTNSYSNFLAGDDEAVEKLRDNFINDIERSSIQDKDVDMLEEEVRHQKELLLSLQAAPNALAQLSDEVASYELDLSKMVQYRKTMQSYHQGIECQLRTVEEKLQQRVMKKRELESEIQSKSRILSQQRISGLDAQKINSQRMELRAKVALAEKDLADIEEQLVAAHKTYQQEKELTESYVVKFNRKAQLMQLTSADGKSLLLKAELTQEESFHFQTVVKPELYLIDKRLVEECRRAEDDLQQAKDSVSHLTDVLQQIKEELKALNEKLIAIDEQSQKSKDVHSRHMQDMRIRISELSDELAKHRMPEGSLESVQRRLRETRENCDQELARLQEEEDKLADENIEFAKGCIVHKEKTKNTLRQMLEQFKRANLTDEVKRDIAELRSRKLPTLPKDIA